VFVAQIANIFHNMLPRKGAGVACVVTLFVTCCFVVYTETGNAAGTQFVNSVASMAKPKDQPGTTRISMRKRHTDFPRDENGTEIHPIIGKIGIQLAGIPQMDTEPHRDPGMLRTFMNVATGHSVKLHGNKIEYTADVYVGTPPQGPYNLQMDTGSSNVWFVSSACDKSVCNRQGTHVYDSSQSSTFKDGAGTASLSYGTGSASGPLVTDVAKIGDLSVPDQTMMSATATTFFANTDLDGIVGLAFASLASSDPPANPPKPWLYKLKEAGVLSAAIMTFNILIL